MACSYCGRKAMRGVLRGYLLPDDRASESPRIRIRQAYLTAPKSFPAISVWFLTSDSPAYTNVHSHRLCYKAYRTNRRRAGLTACIPACLPLSYTPSTRWNQWRRDGVEVGLQSRKRLRRMYAGHLTWLPACNTTPLTGAIIPVSSRAQFPPRVCPPPGTRR